MPATRHARTAGIQHITIVIMENKTFRDIIGNAEAPYINALAKSNVLFTNSYAVTHPSEPNYLALYSGSTWGLGSDACPRTFTGPSLGGEALAARLSVKGYMEDLPAAGSTVCRAGEYARKHNPLIDFSDTPPSASVPYTQISADMQANAYPAIAFVAPNLMNDMHDGSIPMGDAWLRANLPAMVRYDDAHKGILILTWDEDDRSSGNHIPTIAVGQMLKPGAEGQRIDHYDVARTIADVFGLPPLGPGIAVTRLEP